MQEPDVMEGFCIGHVQSGNGEAMLFSTNDLLPHLLTATTICADALGLSRMASRSCSPFSAPLHS